VVIAALETDGIERRAEQLASLARQHRLLLGGSGTTRRLAERIGGEALDPDPVASAAELADSA
jgi:hypothetical protein